MVVRGISYPFRVGIKGGVVMSAVDDFSVAHMSESIQQIILTRPMERSMSFEIFSDVDAEVFAPNDISSHTLLSYQIKKAIETHEPRVKVSHVDVREGDEGNQVFVRVHYTLLNFEGIHTVDVKVGETHA